VIAMPTNALSASFLSLQLVLPAFNEFAARGGLDVELPLAERRVTKSHIGKLSPSVMAVLDHRHQFNWNSRTNSIYEGHIHYYDNSNSVTRMERQRLRELVQYQSVISTNEARQIAERFLTSLGYNLTRLRVGPPRVGHYTYQENPGDQPTPVPMFGVRWFPKGKEKPEWQDVLVEIEVSGLSKRIVRFTASPDAAKAVTIDLRRFKTPPSVPPTPGKGSEKAPLP
jgi:hypothetical protein